MNDYMESHSKAQAIQGYLDTKNPDDTWISRSYALSYWYTNRFWQLARSNWGLSAALRWYRVGRYRQLFKNHGMGFKKSHRRRP